MLADDIDDTSASNIDKRARFRNIIQLIQLTTTILSKGRGPKLPLHSDEPVAPKTRPYTSGHYTYLDAAARLLVRKDEVIAAAECTSFRKGLSDHQAVEVAVMAQPNNLSVVGMFTFCCGLLLRTITNPR